MPQNTPFRILYLPDDDMHTGWEFDDTEYETAEVAYEDALTKYTHTASRIVKLCFAKDG